MSPLHLAALLACVLALGCRPAGSSDEPAPGQAAEREAEPWLFIEDEEQGRDQPPGARDSGSPGAPAAGADSDGDGIPDMDDKCPSVPEDLDGFIDVDGCPDPDNDGDGIPDMDDQCPMQPETFDGRMDEDGCPG